VSEHWQVSLDVLYQHGCLQPSWQNVLLRGTAFPPAASIGSRFGKKMHGDRPHETWPIGHFSIFFATEGVVWPKT